MAEAGHNGETGRIDRFEIVKVLGKGSQGVVYLAVDPRLERRVAIKTLPLDMPKAGERQQLLLQEARIVGRLQHPNIVPIFEAGEHDGKLYLVFEYVEGTTLAELLRKGGAMQIHQAVLFMAQIASGIAYAHEEGVIHGDLTPANILIGRNRLPRVMDFGIARIMGSGEKRQGLWGSLPYMSPEHFSERGPDARSDIFALGLMLWEMLTGKRAIQGDNQLSIMHKIANEELPPPSLRNRRVDPKLDTIVRKAVEKLPEQRYAGAAELAKALDDYLHPEATEGAGEEGGDAKQATLAFLLRRMRHKPDFPAISQHISEINRSAGSQSDSSANELANIILKEYSLTNKLLKLVNSSFYGQYGGRISTVTRAVVILGFEQVRMAAISLMLFEHLQNKSQAGELKDAVLSSLVAGAISKGQASRLTMKEPEQAFVCALLHNLGKMLTIYYFPEEYHQIISLMDQKDMDEEAACRAALGLSYSELGTGIGREWHFPPQIVESMEHLPPGKLERSGNVSELLRSLSNFSNELCRLAANGDPQGRDEALAALAERFERSLGLTDKQVNAALDGAIESIDKYAEVLSIDVEQSPFIKKATRWSRGAEPPPPPPPTLTAAARAAQAAEDHQMALLNGIQEITNALLGDYNVNDIMVMILETMYRGLGLSHVLVCISTAQRNTMKARFGFGPNIDEAIRSFAFKTDNLGEVFGKAVKEQLDLIVTDPSDPAHAGLIPDWYKPLLGGHAFALYPIIINKIPVGMFYVDQPVSPQGFSPNHLNYLKTLRNQAVLAIRQKAGRG